MTITRFSALSINKLSMFDMQNLNGALFLNAASFSALVCSFAAEFKRSIVPFINCLISHLL